MTPPADIFPKLDLESSMAVPEVFFPPNFESFIGPLFLMALALAISLPLAHASAEAFKTTSPLLRWPLRILAQTFAFFPHTALSLSAAGHLAGTLGWPLPSLMPMEKEAGLAVWLWHWTAPLCLLCVPVYTLAFSLLLADEPQPRRVMAGAAALAAAGVMMLAQTFEIFPGMSANSAGMAHGGLFLQSITQTALLALLGMLLTGFCPVPVKKHHPSALDLIRDGALVIGLSPWQAWRRHQMPMLIRPAIALVLDLGAWALALAGSWAVLWPLPYLSGLRAAGGRWLEQPAEVLAAAVPVALCSLSSWLAARIVRHGST